MSLLPIIWVSVFSTIFAQEVTNISDSDLSSRIFYGTKANIKDYPYFAGLSGCGAAIISDRWLLTAAHCIVSVCDGLNVLPDLPINDIALLRLNRPLTFGKTVKAVRLPRHKYERNALHYFAGRGKDETGNVSKQLLRVDLYPLGTDECSSHVWIRISDLEQKTLRPHINQLKTSAFCAKRTKSGPIMCNGDSGSPLVRNNTLVGLGSFMPMLPCERSKVSFFTNVYDFVSWIKSVTGIE